MSNRSDLTIIMFVILMVHEHGVHFVIIVFHIKGSDVTVTVVGKDTVILASRAG